jgi:hypothetical protein
MHDLYNNLKAMALNFLGLVDQKKLFSFGEILFGAAFFF